MEKTIILLFIMFFYASSGIAGDNRHSKPVDVSNFDIGGIKLSILCLLIKTNMTYAFLLLSHIFYTLIKKNNMKKTISALALFCMIPQVSLVVDISHANETVQETIQDVGLTQGLLSIADDAIEVSLNTTQYLDDVNESVDVALASLLKYEEALQNLTDSNASIGELEDAYKMLQSSQDYAEEVADTLTSLTTKLSRVRQTASTVISGVGTALDVYTVATAATTLIIDDATVLEQANAIKDIAEVALSTAGVSAPTALFDLSMMGVEMSLDAARETATTLVDVMIADMDTYWDARRAIIQQVTLENIDKSETEILAIATTEIDALSAEYFKRYSEQMYYVVFGDGGTKLAAGLGHMATGASDINTYNQAIEVFGALASSLEVKTYIEGQIDSVLEDYAEVEALASEYQQAMAAYQETMETAVASLEETYQAVEQVDQFASEQIEILNTVSQESAQVAQEQTDEDQEEEEADAGVETASSSEENAAVETETGLAEKKDEAEALRQENLKISEQLVTALTSLENDNLTSSERSQLESEVKALKLAINENAQAYLDLRSEIQETDPAYGYPIDTYLTVSTRISKSSTEQGDDTSVAEIQDTEIAKSDEQDSDPVLSSSELAELKSDAQVLEEKNTQLANTLLEKLNSLAQNSETMSQEEKEQAEAEIMELGDQLSANTVDIRKITLKIQQSDPSYTSDFATVASVAEAFEDSRNSPDETVEQENYSEVAELVADIKEEMTEAAKQRMELSSTIESSSEELESLYRELQNLEEQTNAEGEGDVSDEVERLSEILEVYRIFQEVEEFLQENGYTEDDLGSGDWEALQELADEVGINLQNVFGHSAAYMEKIENEIEGLYSGEGVEASSELIELYEQRKDILSKINEVEDDIDLYTSEMAEYDAEIADLYEDIQDITKDLVVEEYVAASDNESTSDDTPSYSGQISNNNSNGSMNGTSILRTSEKPYKGMELALWEDADEFGVYYGGTPEIASITNSDSNGTYEYTSWGRWSTSGDPLYFTQADSGDTMAFEGGHWVMGQRVSDIPAQGSATYSGNIIGDYYDSNGVYDANSISGTVSLTANFASQSLSGSLDIKHDGSTFATPSIANGSISLSSGQFSGDLQGGNSGDIRGYFYGENGVTPAEAGGNYHYRSDNGNAIGVFSAKKQ